VYASGLRTSTWSGVWSPVVCTVLNW